jgi:hypothetical protein
MTLSNTARRVLSAASEHLLGLAAPPAALPAAARDAVRRSLLKQGLVAECAAPAEQFGLGWRLPDGTWTAMQITEAGRQAVAAEAPAETMPATASSESLAAPTVAAVGDSGAAAEAASGASTDLHQASAQSGLRDAARALLAAWDGSDNRALTPAIKAKRAALPACAVAGTAGAPAPVLIGHEAAGGADAAAVP